jgi:hypothetical protein
MSLRSSIGCVKNNFGAYDTFGANHAWTYLASKWTETRF